MKLFSITSMNMMPKVKKQYLRLRSDDLEWFFAGHRLNWSTDWMVCNFYWAAWVKWYVHFHYYSMAITITFWQNWHKKGKKCACSMKIPTLVENFHTFHYSFFKDSLRSKYSWLCPLLAFVVSGRQRWQWDGRQSIECSHWCVVRMCFSYLHLSSSYIKTVTFCGQLRRRNEVHTLWRAIHHFKVTLIKYTGSVIRIE